MSEADSLPHVAADAFAALAELLEALLEALAALARLGWLIATASNDALERVTEEPHPHWT